MIHCSFGSLLRYHCLWMFCSLFILEN